MMRVEGIVEKTFIVYERFLVCPCHELQFLGLEIEELDEHVPDERGYLCYAKTVNPLVELHEVHAVAFGP